MSNIQAAIGCAQMSRIDSLIMEKKNIFNRYKNNMSDLPIKLNPDIHGCISGYWMPNLVLDHHCNIESKMLIQALAIVGVDARVFFWPLSEINVVPNARLHSNKTARSISSRSLNLPSYFGMTMVKLTLSLCNP